MRWLNGGMCHSASHHFTICPTVTDSQVLLADKANGKPLSGRDGTFRLVAPKDIRGVRSVRQLVKLEVVLLSPR